MNETLTLLFGQTIQMFLVLLVAPAITGITGAPGPLHAQAGAPIIQPYRV
jgi:formate hydrogenlyase subunit 4